MPQDGLRLATMTMQETGLGDDYFLHRVIPGKGKSNFFAVVDKNAG